MARDLFIGLDLGSHALRMVAARAGTALETDGVDGIEVLAAAQVPAVGIRRGVVTSIEDVGRALALLRSDIERQLNTAVGHAVVGVGGHHVGSQRSRGLVVVSRADNRIGSDDVRRVLEAAGAISFSQNLEILSVIPREFIVDGEGGMKDVGGVQGRRLEVEAVVLTAASQHLKNLRQALSAGDFDAHEEVVRPVATARAVLTPRQRELGVALVDIGHGTTDIAVFEDGQLLAAAVLPIGGAHITNDIAIGLRCAIDAAERAKHGFGVANASSVSKRESFEIPSVDGSEAGSFSRRELAEIIDARLEEIFELVGEELRRIERWRLLPAGVVLSGGTAALPGIVDMARRIFRLPVQLGYPLVSSGPREVVSEFVYATALGLAFTAADAADTRKRRGRVRLPAFPGAVSRRANGGRTRKWFRALLP